MRALLVIFLLSLCSVEFQGAHRAEFQGAHAARRELVVFAYDSLAAKGGLGPELVAGFERVCSCDVKLLPSGDGGQVLNRVELDSMRSKGPRGHVVIGLDQNLWKDASRLVEPWAPEGAPGLGKASWRPAAASKFLPHVAKSDYESVSFLPYDYGIFALMVDTKALAKAKLEAPKSLRDLHKPEWRKKLILEDPRTSTPGLGFLLFTREALGDGFADYWKALKGQWLTLAPGWDAAYGLFLKGEAPLVWSYTTSQAYHEENGDREKRYRAALFDEGQPVQIEGAAIVKGVGKDPAQLALARSFLEYLLTEEVQRKVATHNWMLPVVEGVKLPTAFSNLPKPSKLLDTAKLAQDRDKIQSEWMKAIHESGN